jgi:hypothetical protein
MEPVWSLVCSTCETPAPASAPHTAPSETPVPDAGQRASGTAGQWDSRPMGQRVRHGTAGQWDSQQSLCDTTPSYHYSLWPFMSECECIKSSSESESGKTPAPEPAQCAELDRGFASSPSSTRSHAALQRTAKHHCSRAPAACCPPLRNAIEAPRPTLRGAPPTSRHWPR